MRIYSHGSKRRSYRFQQRVIRYRGFAERVFHLHLRYIGDNDELYFRDYLLNNAAVAKEYERLKLDLQKRYEHDRDAYTSNKSGFVKYYTEQGRRLFAGGMTRLTNDPGWHGFLINIFDVFSQSIDM